MKYRAEYLTHQAMGEGWYVLIGDAVLCRTIDKPDALSVRAEMNKSLACAAGDLAYLRDTIRAMQLQATKYQMPNATKCDSRWFVNRMICHINDSRMEHLCECLNNV